MASPLQLRLGVKTDPIEYRFSFEWLFRLLAEEDIHYAQFGTFFEVYQLPDEYFIQLRRQAEDYGVRIHSVFTSHRELGGFFRDEPGIEQLTRRNYERLIEVAALLGSDSAGSSPGAVLRDQMGLKRPGIDRYIRHTKELMVIAKDRGLSWLTIEPMSCLAEPPTLPEEIKQMAEELNDYHRLNPDQTVRVGYCVDVAHGYADRDGNVRWDGLQLLEAALPYTYELHLKNTDGRFESTFGFSPDERKLGVVQVEQFRDLLLARAQSLPVSELIGYLELSGPKLGRDYSDGNLEDGLRQSLRYLKQAFTSAATSTEREVLVGGDERKKIAPAVVADESGSARVQISPSLMCADMCHLEEHVRRLEAVGVDMLHLDIMDGRFVPNMPMGLVQLGQLRKKTDLPFDVHLMTEDNEFFIEQSAKIGAQLVAIHSESAVHLDRQLQLIRQKGMKAGVALNPATPLSILKYVLDRLDFVLIMAVNPGFAGQDLVKSAIPKIAECRAMLDEHNVDIPIEVDGNVSFVNIPKMVSAGADILVAGTSSLFSKDNSLTQNMMLVRQAIEDGLQTRRAGRSKT